MYPLCKEEILEKVQKDRIKFEGILDIFPEKENIFRALELCPFDQVKVVIIGQDPYFNKGQANGLCFSVSEGMKLPPSLRNIFKELEDDIGIKRSKTDLSDWAENGVLLMNSVLTVREGTANSHKGWGWEEYTSSVINALNESKEGLVFMLWGNYAKNVGKNISREKHLVLEANHPSPLSANRGGWFGCKHFSKASSYLGENLFI
tara:strand:- start:5215 stop:5829 length:615 start_codon:yes stop_codon:yes gene_type:complete